MTTTKMMMMIMSLDLLKTHLHIWKRKANNGRQGNTRRPFSLSYSASFTFFYLTSQFIFYTFSSFSFRDFVSRSIFYFYNSLTHSLSSLCFCAACMLPLLLLLHDLIFFFLSYVQINALLHIGDVIRMIFIILKIFFVCWEIKPLIK